MCCQIQHANASFHSNTKYFSWQAWTYWIWRHLWLQWFKKSLKNRSVKLFSVGYWLRFRPPWDSNPRLHVRFIFVFFICLTSLQWWNARKLNHFASKLMFLITKNNHGRKVHGQNISFKILNKLMSRINK